MKERRTKAINANKKNTSAFIEQLVADINAMKPGFVCYYDRAPKSAKFPYCVVSAITASDLAAGDLSMFDIEIWTDDKLPTATEDLESICDDLRNFLHNKIISQEGVFAGHIGYESRDTFDDREKDLSHRRLVFAARLFYY